MSETENTSLVADKNADEAIHEIVTLEDLEVLKSIAETDTRKTVTEAAERRIKKLSQDDTLRETGMVLPGDGRVYQVEIPGCLVGRQHVLASSEAEAEDKYRRPCGMWRNSSRSRCLSPTSTRTTYRRASRSTANLSRPLPTSKQ